MARPTVPYASGCPLDHAIRALHIDFSTRPPTIRVVGQRNETLLHGQVTIKAQFSQEGIAAWIDVDSTDGPPQCLLLQWSPRVLTPVVRWGAA